MFLLKHMEPVAYGKQRNVFIHPENPALIIKVIRPDAICRAWGKWYKTRRSYGQYLSYMREIGEYVAMHSREGRNHSCFQQVIGFAETDMGLGLVLKAVRGADGGLAPSLRTMLQEKTLDDTAEQALEAFFSKLLASDVIAADLNGGNLVYAHDSENGGHFVMIDGLGQHNLIPLKRISRTLNRRSKLQRIAKLRGRIESSRVGKPCPPPRQFTRRVSKALFATAALACLFLLAPVLTLWKTAPESGNQPIPPASTSSLEFSSDRTDEDDIMAEGSGNASSNFVDTPDIDDDMDPLNDDEES